METTGDDLIEIRIDDVAKLFHTLDPYPFRERDLDKNAEDFVLGWAREFPAKRPIRIALYLPKAQINPTQNQDISIGFARHFTHRAWLMTLELRELFRIGWRQLLIGVTVLAVCMVASQAIHSEMPTPINKIVEESLIIFGWVANWRPIETFLYAWWPIVRRRNLLRRISQAKVEIKPA